MDPSGASAAALEPFPLRVIATAGHVDHGKSSLILRLTGMDPDRLAEEKRRGLTIDLGFAWTVLPSGREVGFVDVPGHERFIRNMLAGVGPVRLVLFVVAADEGWKPQSEEHLQIVDVLGADGAVVALTKRDLVDPQTLAAAEEDVRRRLTGTAVAGTRIVACSAATGEGIDELREGLDTMVAEAPVPEPDARPRLFIDRVFTIRGAGTVVTGTLTGGPIRVGQEAEVLPSGHRSRIRGLQTHKRRLEEARPVSRVAVNLTGIPRDELERGDVLVLPGQWKPAGAFEGLVRPVRGLDHPLTTRGAYKLYAGSAERDVRLQFGTVDRELQPGDEGFARIRLSAPLALDFKDRFVLREAGRRETVAGGVVLDLDPTPRVETDPGRRLHDWATADRDEMARLLIRKRRAIRAGDLAMLTGLAPDRLRALGEPRLGDWFLSPDHLESETDHLVHELEAFHRTRPLSPGLDLADVRAVLSPWAPGLAEEEVQALERAGTIVRQGTTIRLAAHHPSTAGREDADRLVDAVRSAEPSAPTVRELALAGFGADLIRAVCADGRLIRVSPDIVVTPELLARAEEVARDLGRPPGITVSAFREALGTSRKYALPILEYFDARGLTRRQGVLRVVQG